MPDLIRRRPLTFGGGEQQTTIADDAVVAYAVRCNVVLRTDEREQEVPRPLYEYPLLRELYRMRGGDCTLSANWLYEKHTGKSCELRTVPLTRHQLREEMARLQSTFRIPKPNGGVLSLFSRVYGEGADVRFAKVVRDVGQAYRVMASRYAAKNAELLAQRKPPVTPSLADWEQIAAITLPTTNEVDTLEEIEAIEGDVEGMAPVPEAAEDPAMALQEFLVGRDVEHSAAEAIATLVATGRQVTRAELTQIPALSHKREAITMAMAALAEWDSAKKAPAA